MKNLLGKFHADASAWPCSVLLGSAWPCSVPVASLVGGPGGPWPPQNFLFFFCQENFMKNLLGKFHAESMPVLLVASLVGGPGGPWPPH